MDSYTRKRAIPLLVAVAFCVLAAFSLAGCTQTGSSDSSSTGMTSTTGTPLANPTPVKDAEKAVWKVDYVNEELAADFVHDNWRTSMDEFPAEKVAKLAELGLNTEVSRTGMDTLHTIGGADFTANQFDWILAKAEEMGVMPEKLTVLDLRGETQASLTATFLCIGFRITT